MKNSPPDKVNFSEFLGKKSILSRTHDFDRFSPSRRSANGQLSDRPAEKIKKRKKIKK